MLKTGKNVGIGSKKVESEAEELTQKSQNQNLSFQHV